MTKNKALENDVTNLPGSYAPNEKEGYMNSLQLEYFKKKLLQWKKELLLNAAGTINYLREYNYLASDVTDRAVIEQDIEFKLLSGRRYQKLLERIDYAVQKISSGEYGYCEITGEEIGIRRLELDPLATLTVEAQEQYENSMKRCNYNNDYSGGRNNLYYTGSPQYPDSVENHGDNDLVSKLHFKTRNTG